jgi:hypothetical protein
VTRLLRALCIRRTAIPAEALARAARRRPSPVCAKATDVDVSIRPREEWARMYEQKQLAKA